MKRKRITIGDHFSRESVAVDVGKSLRASHCQPWRTEIAWLYRRGSLELSPNH
ncbi:MAG: hypothetical protein IPJ71_17225 [Bdellovibrionales bacterium]|nr:hypothetical protein [Bdellovibrionales bacterium]